jgi:hypothetical protein
MVGEDEQLTAWYSVVDCIGRATSEAVPVAAVWQSSDPTVAAVTVTGHLEMRAPGSTVISAAARGSGNQYPISVIRRIASVELKLDRDTVVVGGGLLVSVIPYDESGAEVAWPPVAQVLSFGVLSWEPTNAFDNFVTSDVPAGWKFRTIARTEGTAVLRGRFDIRGAEDIVATRTIVIKRP